MFHRLERPQVARPGLSNAYVGLIPSRLEHSFFLFKNLHARFPFPVLRTQLRKREQSLGNDFAFPRNRFHTVIGETRKRKSSFWKRHWERVWETRRGQKGVSFPGFKLHFVSSLMKPRGLYLRPEVSTSFLLSSRLAALQ